jgi:hypothetical protein
MKTKYMSPITAMSFAAWCWLNPDNPFSVKNLLSPNRFFKKITLENKFFNPFLIQFIKSTVMPKKKKQTTQSQDGAAVVLSEYKADRPLRSQAKVLYTAAASESEEDDFEEPSSPTASKSKKRSASAKKKGNKKAKIATSTKTTVAVGAKSPDSNKKRAHRNQKTVTVSKSVMKRLSRKSSVEEDVDAQVAAAGLSL